jgi:hypothetical protein
METHPSMGSNKTRAEPRGAAVSGSHGGSRPQLARIFQPISAPASQTSPPHRPLATGPHPSRRCPPRAAACAPSAAGIFRAACAVSACSHGHSWIGWRVAARASRCYRPGLRSHAEREREREIRNRRDLAAFPPPCLSLLYSPWLDRSVPERI